MAARTKTQREVEATITVANECSQVKRLVSPLLICANQRCFGGRTCSGRIPRFAHSAKRRLEWLLRQVPTVYRKESGPVAKRPADERKPFWVSSHKKRAGVPQNPGA